MKKLLTAAVLAASLLVGCATVQQPTRSATEPMMILQSPTGDGYVALTSREEEPCVRFDAKVAFYKYNGDDRARTGCYFNDGTTVELHTAENPKSIELPYNQFQYVEVPLTGN